jgi:GT2 family glycosyltransferase
MVKIGLIVPVYKNFQGFADLLASVDRQVQPFIIPNWRHNHGVSAGWNIGIEQSIYYGCDVVIIANDDIVFDRDTIRKLVTSVWFGTYDLVSAVNTRDQAVTPSIAFDNEPDFACFAIRPEEFTDQFGHFDENFTPAYFEDNDMAYRVKIAGGKMGRRLDAGMFHKGSVTQNWNGEQVVTGPMFESNQTYYMEKWGGVPGQEIYITPWNQRDSQ